MEDNSQLLSFATVAETILAKDLSVLTLADIEAIGSKLPSIDVDGITHGDRNEEDSERFIDFLQTLSAFGRVPETKCREIEMLDQDDFYGSEAKACESMRCLIILLEKIMQSMQLLSDSEKINTEKWLTGVSPSIALNVLILAGEHHGDFMWCNAESRALSSTLIKSLLKLYRCDSIDQVFSSERRSETRLVHVDMFAKVMTEIKPRLTKDKWKKNPALIEVFSYFLFKVKLPDLSENLDLILPPCLNMTDDHEVKNKILGVNCLQHIINNTSTSELKWYGRADVVYEALQHQLYIREPSLLDVTIPCLISCLKVVESSSKSDSRHLENRYDEILQRILIDMEMENLLKNRRIYSKHIVSFMQAMGIVIVRHLPRLLTVITNYLEISDAPGEISRLNALDMLETTITIAWLRMPGHCERVFKGLIKLLYDMSADEMNLTEQLKNQVLEKVTNALTLLFRAVPKVVGPWLEVLRDAETNETCNSVFCKILYTENKS